MGNNPVVVLGRIYLLAGLVLHKAVWEWMKRGRPAASAGARLPKKNPTTKTRLLTAIKIGILAAIMVQTFSPAFLPISENPLRIIMAGFFFYSLGLLIAIAARIQLGRNWSDIEKSHITEGHAVVAHGLYRYVRHPIYTGDLLLLAGLELALNSWAVIAVMAVALYARRQAIREESKLLDSLPGYAKYYRTTSRFIPFPGL
jgi:protein-S-isoprenylcysteine O-methyltransferase Ste14